MVRGGTLAAYSHVPPPVYGEGVTQTTVTVRYFAAAADAAGREEETIALEEPTVSALRTALAKPVWGADGTGDAFGFVPGGCGRQPGSVANDPGDGGCAASLRGRVTVGHTIQAG